jgi:hypothetical protein
MNGLDFLDLVIGLIFIYLIYSIACSTLWEIIVNLSHLRGNMLYRWVLDNFSQPDHNEIPLGEKIVNHPLIKGLSKKPNFSKATNWKPTYISSNVFADVLVDLIVNNDSKEDDSPATIIDINSFKNILENTRILVPGLKRIFLQYIGESSGNLQLVKEKIGKWFDEAQERLIGSYKKNLQIWIFVIAIILVGFTNADTFNLANYLYNNNEVRQSLANQAVLFVRDSVNIVKIKPIDTVAVDSAALRKQEELVSKIKENLNTLKELNKDINQASIPVGWAIEDFKSYNLLEIIKKLGGLLLTAFAVSMGAPFWFDILSKLANLRSAGSKPKSSLDEDNPK